MLFPYMHLQGMGMWVPFRFKIREDEFLWGVTFLPESKRVLQHSFYYHQRIT